MEIEAIEALIQEDEKLRKTVAQAVEQRQNTRQSIASAKKRISEEAWGAVHEKLAQRKKELDQQVSAQQSSHAEDYQRRSSALRSRFEQHRSLWVDSLVNHILGVSQKDS